jgi:hypothetical protein
MTHSSLCEQHACRTFVEKDQQLFNNAALPVWANKKPTKTSEEKLGNELYIQVFEKALAYSVDSQRPCAGAGLSVCSRRNGEGLNLSSQGDFKDLHRQ